MSIEYVNHTTNFKWHLAHSIRETIHGMDSLAKENALLHIRSRLLQDEIPNPEILKYVTALLHGKTPCGICCPRPKGGGSCPTLNK